jgi:hypothetical protein
VYDGAVRALAIAWMLSACSHPSAPVKPPPPAAPVDAPAAAKVGVALDVTPVDAEVLIDGISHGPAASLPHVLELKPGLYTLVIQLKGYTSYRVEFSVADKVESFAVHLDPAK